MLRLLVGGLLVGFGIMLGGGRAEADDWGAWPATVTYYYYPVPITVSYSPWISSYSSTGPCILMTGVRYSGGLSPSGKITPAPASKALQQPPGQKAKTAPKVEESRTYSADEKGAALGTLASKDLCRVGFWNISGRDVTLTVNDKRHVVPKNGSITVPLPREFVWQEGNDLPHRETVSGDFYEIVIR
jgi:hypothetical protein